MKGWLAIAGYVVLLGVLVHFLGPFWATLTFLWLLTPLTWLHRQKRPTWVNYFLAFWLLLTTCGVLLKELAGGSWSTLGWGLMVFGLAPGLAAVWATRST
jgi:hypothetical protein